MNNRPPPELDMTLEGEFVRPPKPTLSQRILLWAVLVAVIAGALSLAAFALWVALIILPVAFGAAVLAYAMFRYRVWRGQTSVSGVSVSGQRSGWRP